MATFTDTEGRSWIVAVNCATLGRCKDAGVDLTRPDAALRIADDVLQLGMALWCMVERQAESRGITPEQFAESLGSGEVIDAAADALLEALVDFTRPGRRAVLRKAIATKQDVDRKAVGVAEQMIDSGEIEREAERELSRLRSSISPTS